VFLPPQQDDNRLLYVRRFDGNDFRIFDRPAATTAKYVKSACIEQRGAWMKLLLFVTNFGSPFTWQNV
jgi:hypothetical protein